MLYGLLRCMDYIVADLLSHDNGPLMTPYFAQLLPGLLDLPFSPRLRFRFFDRHNLFGAGSSCHKPYLLCWFEL